MCLKLDIEGIIDEGCIRGRRDWRGYVKVITGQ
jgi:hypothetical protein